MDDWDLDDDAMLDFDLDAAVAAAKNPPDPTRPASSGVISSGRLPAHSFKPKATDEPDWDDMAAMEEEMAAATAAPSSNGPVQSQEQEIPDDVDDWAI